MDECISEFTKLAVHAFNMDRDRDCKDGNVFDTDGLERHLKEMIREKMGDANVPMVGDSPFGRTFVPSFFAQAAGSPILFRSYRSRDENE